MTKTGITNGIGSMINKIGSTNAVFSPFSDSPYSACNEYGLMRSLGFLQFPWTGKINGDVVWKSKSTRA